MTDNEYLQEVLRSQTLEDDGKELRELRKQREKVETLLREKFSDGSPTIRYGGSKAKGTMIREAYDLDIICYFPRDDTSAGTTLKDIYCNIRTALEKSYFVEAKPSALRLRDSEPKNFKVDFHIDVVPGRYIDDSKTDVFLHQSAGQKDYLKTNIDKHISHVRDSEVVDAIRLMKLWKIRNNINIKNFALELLTIDLLKRRKGSALSSQLEHVWQEFCDHYTDLKIEDPANPNGNDLSEMLNPSVKYSLSAIASLTLKTLENTGWENVFGGVEKISDVDKIKSLHQITSSVTAPTKPWYK